MQPRAVFLALLIAPAAAASEGYASFDVGAGPDPLAPGEETRWEAEFVYANRYAWGAAVDVRFSAVAPDFATVRVEPAAYTGAMPGHGTLRVPVVAFVEVDREARHPAQGEIVVWGRVALDGENAAEGSAAFPVIVRYVYDGKLSVDAARELRLDTDSSEALDLSFANRGTTGLEAGFEVQAPRGIGVFIVPAMYLEAGETRLVRAVVTAGGDAASGTLVLRTLAFDPYDDSAPASEVEEVLVRVVVGGKGLDLWPWALVAPALLGVIAGAFVGLRARKSTA